MIGSIGEEIACKFIISKGFTVLDRNYWKPWGEIDIVARVANSIRFIEVKAVSRENFEQQAGYRAEDNVHPAKIARIHKALQTYLEEKGLELDCEWQIDLITVLIDQRTKRAKIEIIERIS